jgi:hypothetical protein
MKKCCVVIYIMLCLQSMGDCQSNMIVKKNEIVQILDKFIYLSGLPNHFYSRAYVVKLVKESRFDTYSIAITSIMYKDELPKSPLYCLNEKDKYFFITNGNGISIDFSEFMSCKFYNDEDEIKRITSEILIEGGVLYFPSILLFSIHKKNLINNLRKVQYETYHPIGNLSKKYWPVEKPVGAITDKPSFDFTDRNNKPNDAYFSYLKDGRGSFKIKTR